MAINRHGDVSICVRFDPKGLGVIGNIKENDLVDIWNSPKRKKWLEAHKQGKRQEVPLCSYCHFWGVPTGTGDNIKNIRETISDKNVIGKQS